MGGPELNRREVLAGLAAAGTVGAVGGGGAGALLADRETLAAELGAGAVDLLVEGETTGGRPATASVDLDGDRAGSDRFTLSLSEDSNPAYLWLRAACPGGRAGAGVTVEVSRSCGDRTERLAEGSLDDVAADLGEGVLLDADCAGGQPACLEPGGSVEVAVAARLDPADSGRLSATLGFEFVARQCRHRGPENPFPPTAGCVAGAISFVAFCTDSGGALDPEITGITASDGDGPTAVEWETAAEVDRVVVYYGSPAGPQLTVYDYSDEERTAGTATARDPDAAVPSYDAQPGDASRPCAVADRLLAGDVETVSTVKLEYRDGRFLEVDDG
jgi:hypothetical protein